MKGTSSSKSKEIPKKINDNSPEFQSAIEKHFHITRRPDTLSQFMAYAKYASEEGSKLIAVDPLKHLGGLEGDTEHLQLRNASLAMVRLKKQLKPGCNLWCTHHLSEEGVSRYAGNDLNEDADANLYLTKADREDYITFTFKKGRGNFPAPASLYFDKKWQYFDEKIEHPV